MFVMIEQISIDSNRPFGANSRFDANSRLDANSQIQNATKVHKISHRFLIQKLPVVLFKFVW